MITLTNPAFFLGQCPNFVADFLRRSALFRAFWLGAVRYSGFSVGAVVAPKGEGAEQAFTILLVSTEWFGDFWAKTWGRFRPHVFASLRITQTQTKTQT